LDESENRIHTGFTCVTVVSSELSVFAVTRLPSERCARPVMPPMGAVILV